MDLREQLRCLVREPSGEVEVVLGFGSSSGQRVGVAALAPRGDCGWQVTRGAGDLDRLFQQDCAFTCAPAALPTVSTSSP